MGKGLDLNTFMKYYDRYIRFLASRNEKLKYNLLTSVVESKLKKGIDIEEKYHKHINSTNVHTILAIINKCMNSSSNKQSNSGYALKKLAMYPSQLLKLNLR